MSLFFYLHVWAAFQSLSFGFFFTLQMRDPPMLRAALGHSHSYSHGHGHRHSCNHTRDSESHWVLAEWTQAISCLPQPSQPQEKENCFAASASHLTIFADHMCSPDHGVFQKASCIFAGPSNLMAMCWTNCMRATCFWIFIERNTLLPFASPTESSPGQRNACFASRLCASQASVFLAPGILPALLADR
uniref:Uncharacterized protein n=1 Tax=Eutreptiella gymnastica TaxID=73025 RepID=A0A7S4CVT0_9EUGL